MRSDLPSVEAIESALDEHDCRIAAHNLRSVVSDMATAMGQLAETGWGEELGRLRGDLAILVLDIEREVGVEPDLSRNEVEKP